MKRFDPVRIKATGEQGIVLRVVESTVEDRFGVLLTTGDDRLNYFTVREIEPLDEPFSIDTRTSSDDVPVGAMAVETFDAKTDRLERDVIDAAVAARKNMAVGWIMGNRIFADTIDELTKHLAAAPETDGAMLDRLGDDATKWAEEFTKHFYVAEGFFDGNPATFGDIATWFANAIEHSHALRMRGKERVEPTDEALLEFANKRNAAWPEIYGTRTLDDLKIDYLRIALATFNAPTVEPWSREDIRSLAISYCSAMEGISASHDGSERFTFRGARLYEFVYRILAGEKP